MADPSATPPAVGSDPETKSLLAIVLESFALLYPGDVAASEELVESIRFIRADYSPETVVKAGYGAALVSLLPATLVFLTPAPMYLALALLLVVPFGVLATVHEIPSVLAALRRTEALGATPTLVGRAVLRMEIQPTLESAVQFAAESGHGPLAESLSEHAERAMGTPRTGLLTFADEWAEHFPAIRRSSHLLAAAEDAPEGEREQTLERALRAILDGTRDQMAEFTSAIRGPTTGLFAFGVMLPLALVALAPTASIVDVGFSIWVFVAGYNVVLPVGLVLASVWLLVRRPVAFPPPQVPRTHPDLPDHLWTRALPGVLGGAVFYAIVVASGHERLAPVVAVGFGIGIALMLVFRPIKHVRDHVRDVEEHLVDALYLVGRQVSEGESVESAIDLAASRVPGATGSVFEDAAGLEHRLHVAVEEAFLGEYGALRDVPSARGHGTARLLGIASHEGEPAGRALISMADHLEALQTVEAETRRQLEEVTSTLEHTTSFFAPLIGGATVALAEMMSGRSEELELSVDPANLSVVVGVFLISLCLILAPLSIALRHGVDRAMLGYRAGQALVFAMPIYVATIALVSLI